MKSTADRHKGYVRTLYNNNKLSDDAVRLVVFGTTDVLCKTLVGSHYKIKKSEEKCCSCGQTLPSKRVLSKKGKKRLAELQKIRENKLIEYMEN